MTMFLTLRQDLECALNLAITRTWHSEKVPFCGPLRILYLSSMSNGAGIRWQSPREFGFSFNNNKEIAVLYLFFLTLTHFKCTK